MPFVIYADFEAITEKLYGCLKDNGDSYTSAYQKHADCGYGYKLVYCYDDKYRKRVEVFRGCSQPFHESYEIVYSKKVKSEHFSQEQVPHLR